MMLLLIKLECLLCALFLFGLFTMKCEEESDDEETVSNVLGVGGTRVALPCNLTPPEAEDSVALVLWYKDDITKPIYSVDARKSGLEQARHVTGGGSGRFSLNLDSDPSLLYLDGLKDEDEGEYRCRVDFRKVRSRNGIVYLQLVVPPKKPIITDQNGEILESLIGPYNEGDNLSLICEAEEGKPLPSLTWWRESVLLDDTFTVTPHGVVRNELEILSLKRHDLMAVYTCQASNNNFSQPIMATVTVDMNFRPVSVHMEGGPAPMSAHRPAELVCRSNGSKPPALVSWWLGGIRLKHGRDSVSGDGNFTISRISFRPAPEDNGKKLTCRAENSLIPGSAIDDSWDLEIHYVPQLALKLGTKLRHFRIQEGTDVLMECDVRANPWSTEIGWAFEGRVLHSNVTAGINVSNQSLLLQKVHRTQRGHYTCSASNSEGKGESKPLYLPVQFSPVCAAGQKILYGATRHETVRVVCEVEADPPDVTFRWSLNRSNGEGDLQPVEGVQSEGLKSTATVTALSDYATLTCETGNSVGAQLEPCVYSVVTAGPPEPVYNCTFLDISHLSFRLNCKSGSSGGLKQHFLMEVHDTELHRIRMNMSAEDEPRFLASNLTAATSFVVVVYAANPKGRSQAVVMRVNTEPEGRSRGRTGSRWTVTSQVLVVAVVALLFVLILLGVAAVFLLRTRRRIRDQKGHIKRNDKASESLMKNAKETNPDMCIIVPDEDEKQLDISYQHPPEVITMANPYMDELYCARETKSSSSYLGEFDREDSFHKRESLLVRLQNSLTRRKRQEDGDREFGQSDPLHTFSTFRASPLPSSIDQLSETILIQEPPDCVKVTRTN